MHLVCSYYLCLLRLGKGLWRLALMASSVWRLPIARLFRLELPRKGSSAMDPCIRNESLMFSTCRTLGFWLLPPSFLVPFKKLVDSQFAGFVSFLGQTEGDIPITLPQPAIKEDPLTIHVVWIYHWGSLDWTDKQHTVPWSMNTHTEQRWNWSRMGSVAHWKSDHLSQQLELAKR